MERITLNIVPNGITPVCHASQFDIGRVIRLDLMDGLLAYTLSDENIELCVRKPDDNIVTAGVEVVSGSTFVYIVTTEQMTACKGDNKCELRITKGDTNIGTLNFIMRCEEDPLAEGIESETEIHNLETQVADLVSVEVAAQYDSSNVIFDDTPTENHGIGHAVTSEGIKRAIDNVNPDASAVNYDNTDSGLTATNVQDAVDEVNDKADSNATQIGDLSQLTTSDKSSLVGAVNELDSDKLDNSTYTNNTTVTINSLVATGAVYTKKIGNMVMVWGLVTTTASISTGTAILKGMYMNNNGANNVVKFIDNNGTSPDWVLYTPNANNVLLSASSQSSGHSYTVSFIYYST